MSTFTLTSLKAYLDQFDVSGDLNAAALLYTADAPDDTTFGNTTRVRLGGGLKDISASIQGFWESGASPDKIDKILDDRVNVANTVFTLCGQTGAVGEKAHFFRATIGQIQRFGKIGDVTPFSANASATQGPLVRGTVLATGSKASTANGTAYQLGAVSAGQYIYGALHVLSVSGTNPTLDVLVTSDNAEGFSTPTTRLTFSQKTAVGVQWITPVAGAIADDWWRAQWTIGGSDTPTFGFVLVFGIL